MTERVLVTGASGYVGQHVCAHFSQAGQRVTGLARSPRPAALPGIAWIQGEINDLAGLTQAARGCDILLHLACLPLAASAADPAAALRVNEAGTQTVLEAARQAGVGRVVYTSTAQVYGGQAALPNGEDQRPEPASPYAVSKLAGELWSEGYTRTYGLPVTILRLFNVYGPAVDGAPRPTVETRLAQALRAGRRPEVRGHPLSGRDFIHIQDVVCALALAATGAAGSDLLNLGTGVCTPLVAVAERLAELLGTPLAPVVVADGQPPFRQQADTRRSQARLGFQAAITLEMGLRELVEGGTS